MAAKKKIEEEIQEEQQITEEEKKCLNWSRNLIAIQPILYEAKQYAPGDELPKNNAEIIDAWIKNGAAAWEGDLDLERG